MFLSLLLSTFITVFIAELGDKTQLATLTISGTSNKPLSVFLKLIASITFFIIGIRLFISSFVKDNDENEDKENN